MEATIMLSTRTLRPLLRQGVNQCTKHHRRFLSPQQQQQQQHFSTQVGSITFWCSDTAVVDQGHDFFHKALGCESHAAPHYESQGEGSSSWSPNRYRSVVATKDIRVEFVAFPWISKIRQILSLPRCGRLLSIELSTSDNHSDHQQQTQKHAILPAHGRFSSFLPLCLLSSPMVSPTLHVLSRGTNTAEENENVREAPVEESSEGRVLGLKEIVLGMDDELVAQMSTKLSALAQRKLGHGLVSFGEEGEKSTAVRVIPSNCSTVVFKVDACQTAMEAIRRSSPCSFASIGGNGTSRGDFSVESPGLAGLDLRISDSDTHQAHFYETPESSQSDQANFGQRDDMGQMSCVSVVGMEAKHRMRSLPSSLLQQVSKKAV